MVEVNDRPQVVTTMVIYVAETDRAVITALTSLWQEIRNYNPGVAETVAFSLQPGRASSCGSVEWDTSPIIVLNLKDSEGRTLAARDILPTLLHLAAHSASQKSAASEGRYHDVDFAEAARAIGLNVSTIRRAGVGYRPEGLARGTLARYQEQTRALDKALKGWSPEVVRKRDRSAILLTCSCSPPRKVRMSPGVAALGPVRCGICGELFQQA